MECCTTFRNASRAGLPPAFPPSSCRRRAGVRHQAVCSSASSVGEEPRYVAPTASTRLAAYGHPYAHGKGHYRLLPPRSSHTP